MLPGTTASRRSPSEEGGPYHRCMTAEARPQADSAEGEVAPERPRKGKAKQRGRRRRRLHDRPLKPIELELTGFGAGGVAIGHAPDGRVAFVEYGVPGERVLAEIKAEEPSYIEATTVEVRAPSPQRVEPRCEYFGRCGGCQLQHIAYGEQLRLKTGVVREQLQRIGGFEGRAAARDDRHGPPLGVPQPHALHRAPRRRDRFHGARHASLPAHRPLRDRAARSQPRAARRAEPHDADEAAHGARRRAQRRAARAAAPALATRPPRQHPQRPALLPRTAARRALSCLLAGVLPGQLAAGRAADRARRRARPRRRAAARRRHVLGRRHVRVGARAGRARRRDDRGVGGRRRRRRGQPRAVPERAAHSRQRRGAAPRPAAEARRGRPRPAARRPASLDRRGARRGPRCGASSTSRASQ